MATSKLLSRHPNSSAFDEHFNSRRVIGKLLGEINQARAGLWWWWWWCELSHYIVARGLMSTILIQLNLLIVERTWTEVLWLSQLQ